MPTLTYPGDVTADVVGMVMGPATHGGFATCLSATYVMDADHPAGITRATFKDGVRCCQCGDLCTTADADPRLVATAAHRGGVRVSHTKCPEHDPPTEGADQ